MAANIDITLRRRNATDFDVLYPTTRWSQVDEKPTTFTPTAHTHGDIQDTGVLASIAVTPASGDYLILSDASAGTANLLKRGVAIGTTTNSYLNNAGGWVTPILSSKITTAYSLTTSYVTTGLAVTLLAGKYYRVSFYGNYTKTYTGTNNMINLDLLFSSVSGTPPTVHGSWTCSTGSPAASTTYNTLYTASTTQVAGNTMAAPANASSTTEAPVSLEAVIYAGGADRTITMYATILNNATGTNVLLANACLVAIELA